MLAHLDGMSRDIARMEILGPNDAAMLRYLEQLVEQEAVKLDVAAAGAGGSGTRFQDKAGGEIKLARDMYAHITGGAMPVNDRRALPAAG